jgi:type VI secretion system protein VasD
MSNLHRITPACALLALAGCGTGKAAACDKPPPFFARLDATEGINPDPLGKPLPTVVQFLQIKDSVKLENPSFQKLWAEPKVVLGEDLLVSAEFVVAPGHELGRWVQRDPKAQFVAAVGLFRNPLGYSWFAVAKLPAVSENQCMAPPKAERDAPEEDDLQLRFKIQDNQIDYLRSPRSKR